MGKAQFDAPADVPEDRATGHAIYDRTLGQFVGEVYRPKAPTDDQVKAAVAKGHVSAVVRV
jgi:hypothetical protein